MDTDDVTFRDLATGDAGWLIQQHAELYAASDGFDASFEALVAEILADFIRNRDPAVERAWIAVDRGVRLGSIFCTRETEDVARLRLFFVMPEARGMGLGKRLLAACIAHARANGFRYLRLWTHESHRAACAMYRTEGFELIASKQVRNFGQDLVEQNWQLRL